MSEWRAAVKDRAKRCRAWLASVWDRDVRRMPRWQRPMARFVRMCELVWRGFRSDECQLHASALTFRSLMAIVPVLALSLALARVFGGDEIARTKVMKLVDAFASQLTQDSPVQTNDLIQVQVSPTNVIGIVVSAQTNALGTAETDSSMTDKETGVETEPEADSDAARRLAEELRNRADQLFTDIEELDFKKLGGVGLTLLLWMVISVLGKVEASFNRVWGVTSGRPFWRKFTEYLTVIIVLPFLILVASTLSVSESLGSVFGSQAGEAVRGLMGSAILNKVSGWGVSTLLFAFLLIFMPNTRVRLTAGLMGGAVAATLFIGWLKLCTALQVGVARNDLLFGSFALVPILLAWVFVSWEIVLFGAEVAFGWQNAETFKMEKGAENASPNSRILAVLSVTYELVRRMKNGESVMLPTEFAHEHCIAVRMVNHAADLLVETGLAAQVGKAQEEGLALITSPEDLRVADVVRAVLKRGVTPSELGVKAEHSPLPKTILQWDELLPDALDCTFSELVEQKA